MQGDVFSIGFQRPFTLSVTMQVIIGVAIGYLAASISESFCHRLFGHAPKWLRVKWIQYPRILGWLRWFYWSHSIIHHGKTFKRDFITQFRSPDEKNKLDNTLNREELTMVRKTHYGLTILVGGFPFFMGPPAVVLPILKLFVGNWSVMTAFPMLLLPPLLSMIVHPLIHRPYRQAEKHRGAFGALMRSRYIRYVIRHHWLHHKYPACNFNLLLLGDWILCTHRNQTPEDIKEMSDAGIPLE